MFSATISNYTIDFDQKSSFENPETKPIQENEKVAIFLDIDGVLIENLTATSPLIKDIHEKAHSLFGQSTDEKNFTATPLQIKSAAAHFLSQDGVFYLDLLIRKIAETTNNICIIITSTWRDGVSAEDLKNKIFVSYTFSKFIVDKTPDRNDPEFIEAAKIKYKLEVINRAGEIDYWLRENKDKMGIKRFVILDDVDSGLSEHFPNQFCRVEHVTSNCMTQHTCEKALDLLKLTEKR